MADRDSSDVSRIDEFYSKIARPYDVFASSVLFRGVRRRAIEQLDLRPGEDLLEVGCGTGGNLPHVASEFGREGTYIGIDVSGGMLARALERDTPIETHFVKADATDPPVRGPFDGILVTFVNGVLEDPAIAVDRWLSLLRPGGRLVLLDAAGRSGPVTPLELGFRAFVVAVAPPGTRKGLDRSPNEVLVDRVEAAHRQLRETADVVHQATYWRGFVRLTAATPVPRQSSVVCAGSTT